MDTMTFIVDGVTLPAPSVDGVSVTPNKIWSANAGRNSSTGLFTGDIVCTKYSVSLTWSYLTQAQMQILWDIGAASSPWHSLRFPLNDGTTRSIICYMQDVTYNLRRFDMQHKTPVYKGVTAEFTEK